MTKQVIIIRKDLGMRKGKMIAQGAHASMKVIFDTKQKTQWSPSDKNCYELHLTKEMEEWINGIFTKIVVYVQSELELIAIYESAKNKKISCALIEDNGLTEFKGVKTATAVAIGPDLEEKINEITGHLPLL